MFDYLHINGQIIPHTVFPIVKDGACLFRSLSFLMFGSQSHNRRVRNAIVRHVTSRWETFQTLTYNASKSGDNYSSKIEYHLDMSNQTTFGTTCELVAAGEIFQYLFEVFVDGKIYFRCGDDSSPVRKLRFTGNLNGGHFDAYMVKKKLNVVSELLLDIPISEQVVSIHAASVTPPVYIQPTSNIDVTSVNPPVNTQSTSNDTISAAPSFFNQQKLPTKKDVLQRLLMLYNESSDEQKKIHMFCEKVIHEIDHIWKKTMIPVILESSMRVKVSFTHPQL